MQGLTSISTTTTVTAAAGTIAGALGTVAALVVAASTIAASSLLAVAAATAVTTTTRAVATAGGGIGAASTAAAATAAATAGIGKVNLDATTVELLVVELTDSALGVLFRGKRYEAKATGAASFAIAHHNRIQDLTMGAEEVMKGLIGGRPVNKANEVRGKESKHETSKPIRLCRTGRKK